jgi:hypothetical protein
MPRLVSIRLFDGSEGGSAQGRPVVKPLFISHGCDAVLTLIFSTELILRYLAERVPYGVYSGY